MIFLCINVAALKTEITIMYCFQMSSASMFRNLSFYLFILVCCPENTYGPKCKSCPGGTKSPCGGNGKCDVSVI